MNESSLQLTNATKGHLPLMVVGAVSRAGAGLLFASHVQSQVAHVVVLLVAVLVVNTLFGGQWTAQIFGHDKAVLKNEACIALHRTEQGQVGCINVRRSKLNVSVRRDRSSSSVLSFLPLVEAGPRSFVSAWTALAIEIRSLELLSQSGQWEPANGFASRTRHCCGHARSVVHASQLNARQVYRFV